MRNKDEKPVEGKRMTLVLGNGTLEEIKTIKEISSHSTIKTIVIQAIHVFSIILKARKEGYNKIQLINPDNPQAPPREMIVC